MKLPSITTLKLPQLLERWPHFSLENIYELADQGYFGLYIKPHRASKTSHDIQKHIDVLIKKEPENEYYNELMQVFDKFIGNNPVLIENKPGYSRFPTSAEIKIFSLCEASSIQRLNKYKRIEFYEYNNTFGITKENDTYKCHSFLLRASSLTGQYSQDYKGHFSKDEIFVFIDQIEHFEKSIGFEVDNSSQLPNKQEIKTNRVTRSPVAWRRKVIAIFDKDKCMENKLIWNELRNLAKNGDDTIIDVTSWSATNAHLIWKSPSTKRELCIVRHAFQTFLSTLRLNNFPTKLRVSHWEINREITLLNYLQHSATS